LHKFSDSLGLDVCDLIYDYPESSRDIMRSLSALSDYEIMKVAVYIDILMAEKNENSESPKQLMQKAA
jgi:hypothetical protein